VLDAMRRRPAWYERFVETPLGRRQAPLLPAYGDAAGYRAQAREPSTGRHESDDARLLELAALAVAAIESRLGCGDDERTVVVDVIRTAFAAGTGAEQLDAVPGTGLAEDERVTSLLDDERSVDRLVSLVLDIVRRPE
jgi:hypothetical protein